MPENGPHGQVSLPQEKDDTASETIVRKETALYLGPLPPVSEFERYERVLPGAGERILAMAERQQQFEIEMERRLIEHECRNRDRGQLLGFLSLVLLVCAGLALAWLQAYKTAAFVFGTTIVGVLAAFILGRDGFRSFAQRQKASEEEGE